LLTGRPPFQADNPLDTLMQVLQREPVPPRQLNAAVPRDLETICLKCLEKEPSKRYGSAQKLVADLGRFLDGQPIVARPTTTWERTLKWARRRPAVAALLLIGTVTAIGLPLLLAGWLHDAELRAKAVEDLDVAARDLQSARDQTAKEQKLVQDAQTNLEKANENFKTVFRAADKNLQTVIKEVEIQKQKAKDTELRATGILLTAHSVAVRPDNPGLALNLAVEGASATATRWQIMLF
ncbi:MAG TPA: hypothetical protein VN688_32105, partial [Gemmataceae bacterium]|nr:hypothetical protein [Gemmataceae bacterium]